MCHSHFSKALLKSTLCLHMLSTQITVIHQGIPPPKSNRKENNYGVLCYIHRPKNQKCIQCLPKSLQKHVIVRNHSWMRKLKQNEQRDSSLQPFQGWRVLEQKLSHHQISVMPCPLAFLISQVLSSYFSLYSYLQFQALNLSASNWEKKMRL